MNVYPPEKVTNVSRFVSARKMKFLFLFSLKRLLTLEGYLDLNGKLPEVIYRSVWPEELT